MHRECGALFCRLSIDNELFSSERAITGALMLPASSWLGAILKIPLGSAAVAAQVIASVHAAFLVHQWLTNLTYIRQKREDDQK
jgi:hypothetical protein